MKSSGASRSVAKPCFRQIVQLQRVAAGVSVTGRTALYLMKPQWHDPVNVFLSGVDTDIARDREDGVAS